LIVIENVECGQLTLMMDGMAQSVDVTPQTGFPGFIRDGGRLRQVVAHHAGISKDGQDFSTGVLVCQDSVESY
jgi:hypothetical protein